MDSVTRPPAPTNEVVRLYAPGSPERASLEKRLVSMAGERLDLPCAIGAERPMGSGEQIDVVGLCGEEKIGGVGHK